MNTPPRPTVTPELKLQAAQVIAAKLDADAQTIADHYSLGMDGYQLARELDRSAYWDCTRDDVDVLDEMDLLVADLVEQAEREWAAEHNVQPNLPIGARIKFRHGTGEITGIYEHIPARYLVREDGYDDSKDNRRAIVKFEDAVAFVEVVQ